MRPLGVLRPKVKSPLRAGRAAAFGPGRRLRAAECGGGAAEPHLLSPVVLREAAPTAPAGFPWAGRQVARAVERALAADGVDFVPASALAEGRR